MQCETNVPVGEFIFVVNAVAARLLSGQVHFSRCYITEYKKITVSSLVLRLVIDAVTGLQDWAGVRRSDRVNRLFFAS